MRTTLLAFVLVLASACGDNHQNAGQVAGPNVDTHCRGESITGRPSVGDTTVSITCPPQSITPAPSSKDPAP
jgi:hypothetical protein